MNILQFGAQKLNMHYQGSGMLGLFWTCFGLPILSFEDHAALNTTWLKGIMHIFSNPLARLPVIPRLYPENLKPIGPVVME